MRKSARALLWLCALLFVSGPATAGYVGFAIGQTKVQDWRAEDLNFDGSVSNASAEDTDTGFRLLGGYDINPNLAFELGYSDFGEATADGTSDGTGGFWSAGPVGVKAAVEGFDFGFRGQLPLSESMALVARLGVLLWDFEAELRDSGFGTLSGSDDGNDVFFGIGAEFKAAGQLGLRVEFARYAVDDADLDSMALSLIYRLQP